MRRDLRQHRLGRVGGAREAHQVLALGFKLVALSEGHRCPSARRAASWRVPTAPAASPGGDEHCVSDRRARGLYTSSSAVGRGPGGPGTLLLVYAAAARRLVHTSRAGAVTTTRSLAAAASTSTTTSAPPPIIMKGQSSSLRAWRRRSARRRAMQHLLPLHGLDRSLRPRPRRPPVRCPMRRPRPVGTP